MKSIYNFILEKKSINNFILEKLKLNSQSKLKGWSIKDAKDGDVITFEADNHKYIFIFKFLDKNWKHVDHIYGYAHYTVGADYVNFCTAPAILSIASLDKVSEENFYLSTEDEKQLLFDMLEKEGYKWDPIKKELKKL